MTRCNRFLAGAIVTILGIGFLATITAPFATVVNDSRDQQNTEITQKENPHPSVIPSTPGYLRQAAYGYALQWYSSRNPQYQDYTGSGGDCANFVSQCLIAGGISLHKGTDGTGYGVYPDRDRPSSYSNGTMPYCDYLNLNLKNYQNTSVTYVTTATVPAEVTVGDPVIFGDASGDHYEHAMIVVWDGGSEVGLAAHTTDCWNRTFSSVFSSFSCATFYHYGDWEAEYHRFEVNRTDAHNVRVGPGYCNLTSTLYQQIATIQPGQQYIAFGSEIWNGKRWWHFWLDDRAAWCADQEAVIWSTKEVTGNTTDGMQPIEVEVSTVLNVRDGPGTGYAIYGQVFDGMRFVSDYKDGSWYRYWYGGVQKYSSASYFTVLNESVPQPPPILVNKTVMGFLPYWVSYNQNFTAVTHLAWFSVEMNSDGTLGNKHGWPVTSVVNAVHAAGRKIVLTVTMFSSSDIHTMLQNSAYRATAVATLLTEVQNGNADGICVDFENPTNTADKPRLVDFMHELNASFTAWRADAHVSICGPSKDWWNTYDYDQLAYYSYIMCMGYGYYYGGSANAGPTSPLAGGSLNLENTLTEYMTYGCPRSKLIMGLPFYGYDYPVQSTAKQSATRGSGSSITYTSNIAKIAQYSATVYYDDTFESPWYSYYVSGDGYHQVWCENLTSLAHKFDWVLDEDLAGIGIWAWGYQGSHSDVDQLVYAKFFEDKTPPTVNITSPANNSIISQDSVTVVWEGHDDRALKGYEISLDNGAWQNQYLNTTRQFTGLTPGNHNVTVRANDTSDNFAKSLVNFTIGSTGDTTIPFVRITSPSNYSTTDQTSVTISWIGSDNVAIGAYSISLDGGAWVDKGTSTSHQFDGLTNALHNVTVRANDTSDNVNTSIVYFTVNNNLDLTPPTVDITAPLNGSTVDQDTVTIQWTGSDNVGIEGYYLSDNGSAWISLGLSMSYQLTLYNQGLHNVTIRANDTSDNIGTDIVFFTVDVSHDITPPTITITSPASMGTLVTSQVTINWTGSDNYGIFNYLVAIDGAAWRNNGTNTAYIATFADGYHSVAVCANDTSGNNATDTIFFWVDTTGDTQPPQVFFLTPSNHTFFNYSLITFEWNGTDNEGIDAFSISIDGSEWSPLGLITTGVFYFPDGQHLVQIQATDINGNKAQNTTIITIDTTAPQLSFTMPTIEVGKIVTLSWSATDASTSIVNVQVLLDGEEIYSGIGTSCQLGPFTEVGTHTIEIRVQDQVGHTTIETKTFTVGPTEQFPYLLVITVIAVGVAVIAILTIVLKRRGHSRNLYYPKLLKK